MTVTETRALSAGGQAVLVAASAAVIAASYGLVRLAYGLFLPDVQAELGLDTDTAGLVSSGASIVYCIATVIGLFFAARRPGLMIVGAGATAGFGAIGMALAPTAGVFALFAVLSSIGSGLASPAVVNILQRNIAPGKAGQAQMVAQAGGGPGLIGAAILALILLPDWRLAWGISGAVMILTCVVVLIYDRNTGTGAGGPQTTLSLRWFRDHLLPIAAALLIGIGSGTVWTYGRNLLVDAGSGGDISVFAWMALGLGGTVVIVTARWTDRLRPQAAWILAALVTAFATAALALLPGIPALALAACALFGWGYIACCGVLILWTIQIDAPRAAAGTAVLLIVLVFGQAIGAAMAGFIAVSAGYLAAFVAAAAVSLAAALIVLLAEPAEDG